MAAHDPQRRREAASIASRARIARMTDDQRRSMTDPARRALRAYDLQTVDNEARKLGQYPLPADVRAFRANLLAAVRAKRASNEAKRQRKVRAAQAGAHHEGRS